MLKKGTRRGRSKGWGRPAALFFAGWGLEGLAHPRPSPFPGQRHGTAVPPEKVAGKSHNHSARLGCVFVALRPRLGIQ